MYLNRVDIVIDYLQSLKQNKKLGYSLLCFVIAMIFLTVLQDYMQAYRRASSFYITESLLFKTIWIMYLPIIPILSICIDKGKLNSSVKAFTHILASIILHVVALTIVFIFLSEMFYNGRYGLHKILSYTIANDIYVVVLIYSVYVIGRVYFVRPQSEVSTESITNDNVGETRLNKLQIKSGVDVLNIDVADISRIVAATPYVAIHVAGKKYLFKATLKTILLELNDVKFIRIHKSMIINVDKVISYRSRNNGDYDVIMSDNTQVRLSRTYASVFKSIISSYGHIGSRQ